MPPMVGEIYRSQHPTNTPNHLYVVRNADPFRSRISYRCYDLPHLPLSSISFSDWNTCLMQKVGEEPQPGEVYQSPFSTDKVIANQTELDGTVHYMMPTGAASCSIHDWLTVGWIWVPQGTSVTTPEGETTKQMDKEQADRWCREHGVHFYSIQYPSTHDKFPDQIHWDLSGWAWPNDRTKDKVRIHIYAHSLEEGAQRYRTKYEETLKS